MRLKTSEKVWVVVLVCLPALVCSAAAGQVIYVDGDAAVGVVNTWPQDGDVAAIRAPQLDLGQIRCIVVGDATVDFG